MEVQTSGYKFLTLLDDTSKQCIFVTLQCILVHILVITCVTLVRRVGITQEIAVVYTRTYVKGITRAASDIRDAGVTSLT